MRRALEKLLSALSLLLGLSPALVLTGAAVAPGAPVHWLAWGAACACAAVFAGLLPGKWRAGGGLAGAVIIAGAALRLLPGGAAWLLFLPAAAAFALVLWGAPHPPFDEWPFTLWIAFGGLHLLGLVLARLIAFQAGLGLQRILLFAYMPVLLLQANRFTLQASASPKGDVKPPRRISAGNRRLVLGISVLVVLVANAKRLREWFSAAASWALQTAAAAIFWFLSLFGGEMPLGSPSGSGAMDFMSEAPEETALFWVILERIAMVLAAILVVLLVALGGYKLYGVMRRLLAKLMQRLRESLFALGGDVQEKTESIFDWRELRLAAGERIQRARKRLRRAPRWEDMDNRGRVRWSYRQMLGQRPEIKASDTAREWLSRREQGEAAAEIYERARYSKEPINDEDAAFMRDAARREG